MAVTICFDFGNTRLKAAVFEGETLSEIVIMESATPEAVERLVGKFKPDKTLLASVIHHDETVEQLLSSTSVFHKLDHRSKIPITSPVGRPDTIGPDRLGLVVGAVKLYPGFNNLVVGLGTAITYNFVNKYNEFLGGGISPGMEMRLKSLQTFTAKLPLVSKDWNFPLIGYDTRTNILSGVILGMAKEIDGMIDEYRTKYRNFNVVLTGGDAPYFAYHIKNKIFADPNLMYKGLYAISELNNV